MLLKKKNTFVWFAKGEENRRLTTFVERQTKWRTLQTFWLPWQQYLRNLENGTKMLSRSYILTFNKSKHQYFQGNSLQQQQQKHSIEFNIKYIFMINIYLNQMAMIGDMDVKHNIVLTILSSGSILHETFFFFFFRIKESLRLQWLHQIWLLWSRMSSEIIILSKILIFLKKFP